MNFIKKNLSKMDLRKYDKTGLREKKIQAASMTVVFFLSFFISFLV